MNSYYYCATMKKGTIRKYNALQLLLSVLFVLMIISAPVVLFAQSGPGGAQDTVDTPIDGGVSLLVLGGIGYGAKKLYNSRKAKKSIETTK